MYKTILYLSKNIFKADPVVLDIEHGAIRILDREGNALLDTITPKVRAHFFDGFIQGVKITAGEKTFKLLYTGGGKPSKAQLEYVQNIRPVDTVWPTVLTAPSADPNGVDIGTGVIGLARAAYNIVIVSQLKKDLKRFLTEAGALVTD